MAWFSVVATWFVLIIVSDHLRGLQGILLCQFVLIFSHLKYLRLGPVFFELEWKIINSVFVTLRDNMLALSHWEKCFRSRFICFANVSSVYTMWLKHIGVISKMIGFRILNTFTFTLVNIVLMGELDPFNCMFLSCHVRVSEWHISEFNASWPNGWVFV